MQHPHGGGFASLRVAATDGKGMPADCPYHAAHMAAAQHSHHDDQQKHDMDTRGDLAMGFSQGATIHHFRLTPDGGAIEVSVRDASDATSAAAVRAHLQAIATAFGAGDFSIPVAVHAQTPPGVEGMKAAAAEIHYQYQELPAGGRVAIHAGSPTTVAAVHDFLRFQIVEHETGDSTDVPR